MQIPRPAKRSRKFWRPSVSSATTSPSTIASLTAVLPAPNSRAGQSASGCPSLRPNPVSFPGDVQETAVPLVLGLEQPSRALERLSSRCQEDGLDLGEGLRRSWAHRGSWAALEAPAGPPHEEVHVLLDLLRAANRRYAWPSAGASNSSDLGRRIPSSASSILRSPCGPRAASHSS